MARTQRAKIETRGAEGVLKYAFSDGQSFNVNAADLEPKFGELSEVGRRLLTHGLKQKLSDSYADPDSDAYHEVRSLYAELEKGVWSQRAESGGPRVTILAIALANLKVRKQSGNPKDKANDDQISAMVEELEAKAELASVPAKRDGQDVTITGKEAVKAYQSIPAVKAEMERIKAERATAKARDAAKAAVGTESDLPF